MNCPSCDFMYTYEENGLMVCSACQYSWDPVQLKTDTVTSVMDAHNNPLMDGDDVIVTKDLRI